MKTKHFIGLLALLSLTACEKPHPTSVEPIDSDLVSVINTYQENPFTFEIDTKKTDVYVFSKTASISFDTVVHNNRYRRLLYSPSECPLLQSNYDTIHKIKLRPDSYKILIDNMFFINSPSFWDTAQEDDTLRWYHLHEVSVSDTIGFVVADTFFRKEFYIGNN